MVKARLELRTKKDGVIYITEREAFNFENAMELVMSDIRAEFDATTIYWSAVIISLENK